MTDRERTYDLDTTRVLRARRSTDAVVAQYIRELAAQRDDCRAPAEAEAEPAWAAGALA